jgi:DNA-binding MarR family transcriptional regulator
MDRLLLLCMAIRTQHTCHPETDGLCPDDPSGLAKDTTLNVSQVERRLRRLQKMGEIELIRSISGTLGWRITLTGQGRKAA